MKPSVDFFRKKLDNAFEIMCSLRLLKDIDLVAVALHLLLKPPVEFVRKKLDNAFEIMCSLRLSIDINLVAFILHL